MGDVLICPRCGFRSEGADPMTRPLPSCGDPHCALDRVDGRPVGPERTAEEQRQARLGVSAGLRGEASLMRFLHGED